MSSSGATRVGCARWRKTATSPRSRRPSSRRGARASVPAGVLTVAAGQRRRRRPRRAALATRDSGGRVGAGRPRACRARELGAAAARPSTRRRMASSPASSSTTPGALGCGASVGAGRRLGDEAAPHGPREQAGGAGRAARRRARSNSGSPARRTRISAPQVVPSATKALRSSGPMPAGVSRSRKRGCARGGRPSPRCSVAALRAAARQLGELVDVLDRVLVVREDREAVRDVLQAVLRDQVRARVERVPAGAVERQRALAAAAAASSKNSARAGRAQREPLEVVQHPLGVPGRSRRVVAVAADRASYPRKLGMARARRRCIAPSRLHDRGDQR